MERDNRWRWFGILGGVLILSQWGCAEQTSISCYTEEVIAPGVTLTRCGGDGLWEKAFIKIDKTLSNSELWVLEEPEAFTPPETPQLTATPQTPTDAGFIGRYLDDFNLQIRSLAKVQINGYTFSCRRNNPSSDDKSCYNDSDLQYPTTTVYESTKKISEFELTPDPKQGISKQYMLTFKPRGLGQLIEASTAGTVPVNEIDLEYYNAVGNSWPHLIDKNQNGELDKGECIPGPKMDWTILGASDTHVIMLYLGNTELNDDTCAFLLTELGVRFAFQMDGSGSAGMHGPGVSIGHTSNNPFDLLHRRIPYRIGLVTLEVQNRVDNGGFERPLLTRQPSTTPPGFHSYSGMLTPRDLNWSGAMFLYNAPLYNEWLGDSAKDIPSRGNQVAGIWTRDDETNHIRQELTVPSNRYCMLHFFHGYSTSNRSKSPRCPAKSTLEVKTTDIEGNPKTIATYHSNPTMGPGARLNEQWLRLLTPDDAVSGVDTSMRLYFTAKKEDENTPGNCEVLLDDVSVHCVE